jgi:drug/metabolite transporter (DMT)-like permease
MSLPAPIARSPPGISALDLAELMLLGLVWGASFLFMRVAAPEFGPVPLIAVRVTVAALVLAPLCRPWVGGIGLGPWRALLVVGLLNSALPFCLFAYAALWLPAGTSAVLNATAALWGVALGALCFGVAVKRAALVGVLLGVAGVALMVAHKIVVPAEGGAGAATTALAITAALLATACYGWSAHYCGRRLSSVPPRVVAAASQGVAALLLLLPGWWMWPAQWPSARAWACAVALGVLCTALAYLMYFRLIARLGTARAMTVTMLVPAFGVLLGVALLDEPFTFGIAAGGALVAFGCALVLNPWPTRTTPTRMT